MLIDRVVFVLIQRGGQHPLTADLDLSAADDVTGSLDTLSLSDALVGPDQRSSL